MGYATTKWLSFLAGAATLALSTAAMAKDITLSFYYPIAVGGPIPKIIDGCLKAHVPAPRSKFPQ